MLQKEAITKENFEDHLSNLAKDRENPANQDAALEDIRTLRMFAVENGLLSYVAQTFLEEALIWQHKYMSSKNGVFLDSMEQLVTGASEYVKSKGLVQWESRIARFQGRVSDYKKKFAEAVAYYDTAIEKISSDPAYTVNPALVFEYKAFKIIDEVRLGNVDKGVSEAKELYEAYLFSEKGKGLRERDYTTWAIWRSGLLVNLSKTLIDLGLADQYKGDIKEWLEKAEQNLKVPEGVTLWADFSFRKNEIDAVRESLGI